MRRREQLHRHPLGSAAATAGIVLGTLGLIVGQDVSQGMTNSLRGVAGPVAHLWGLELAAGGVLMLVGLYWRHSELETPGLWMLAAGYAFYAITVVVGLGFHGLAAGIISAALAIGCVIKVRATMRKARAAEQATRERGEA